MNIRLANLNVEVTHKKLHIMLVCDTCISPSDNTQRRFQRKYQSGEGIHGVNTTFHNIYLEFLRENKRRNLSNDTARDTIKIDILTGDMFYFRITIPGYPDIQFPLTTVGRLKKYLKEKRPNIIFVNSEGILGWFTLLAAHSLKKEGFTISTIASYTTNLTRVIPNYIPEWMKTVVGNTRINPIEDILNHIGRQTFTLADMVMVPTEDSKREIQAMGLHKDITVWPRGVDRNIFHPQSDGETNPYAKLIPSFSHRQTGESPKIILYLARIAPEKRWRDIVRLMENEEICRELLANNYHIVFVGPGTPQEISSLTEVVKKHSSNMHYLGPISPQTEPEKLGEVFRFADVFVLPSHHETYGQVVNEALVSGVPVIVPGGTVQSKRVKNFVTGILYDKSDESKIPNRLKEAILQAATIDRQRLIHETSHLGTWREAFEILLTTMYSLAGQQL